MIQRTRTTAHQIQRTPTGRPGAGCQSHGTSCSARCPFSVDNSLGRHKLGAPCSGSGKSSGLRHTGRSHLLGHDRGSVGYRDGCQLGCGEHLQGPLMLLTQCQQTGLITLAVQAGHASHSGSSEAG
ncbi:MAG: hypothetical protein TH68_01310 [Candidatus Synechococcus spongiarum 142]|uniref:Uncharacterized protein n=1 Tax=Candidatus Synechococcus spongiarum 142 TaxID=1608213 RepID=A0A6N3X6M6_9SYNE|nr:MAG: hypothetical protein TH68_01310 [Candidatus Synechococcus spongiarum 142]